MATIPEVDLEVTPEIQPQQSTDVLRDGEEKFLNQMVRMKVQEAVLIEQAVGTTDRAVVERTEQTAEMTDQPIAEQTDQAVEAIDRVADPIDPMAEFLKQEAETTNQEAVTQTAQVQEEVPPLVVKKEILKIQEVDPAPPATPVSSR